MAPLGQPPTVDVWVVSAAVEPSAEAVGWLAAHERERARRFADECLRRRFVARRVALRALLSRYTGAAPAAIEIWAGPWGRPAAATVEFNASSSGDLALIAVSHVGAVGVDVERLVPLDDVDGLARVALSPRERAVLAGLEPSARPAAFLAWWTRKEAVLKGRGTGLRTDPRVVDLPLAPAPAPVACAGGWAVASLEPEPGYVAAVAARGTGWRPVLRRWPERRDEAPARW